MVTYMHTRGTRATGWPISQWPLPGMSIPPVRVRGDGTFEIPDDAPARIHEMIRESGHRPVERQPRKPKKAAEPVDNGPVPEWYPEALLDVNGVGVATLKRIFDRYPHPADILRQDATGTAPGGPVGKVWPAVVRKVMSLLEPEPEKPKKSKK